MMAALLLALPATAAAQSNNAAGATALPYLTQSGPVNSAAANTEVNEPLACNNPPSDDPNATMNRTYWWRITGTGRAVGVFTDGSGADTVLAVYDDFGGGLPVGQTPIACDDDDDTLPGPPPALTSFAVFNSVAGQSYLVQVGVFTGAPDGTIQLMALSPPTNDDRADAEPRAAGTNVQRDNISALTEPGEDLTCEAANNAPLGSTVWFRFSAPGAGQAVFTATPPLNGDTVIQVYRGNDASPTACNDDVGQSEFQSRVTMDVVAGDYFVQVGGYGGDQTEFAYATEFTAAQAPPPTTPPPTTTPPEPPAPDSDGDGIPDASDRCPGQNSSARDGNRDGCLDFERFTATPKLRAVPTRRGVRVRSLSVRAPRGARVSIRCRRPTRACRRQAKRVGRSRSVTFPALAGKVFGAGTQLDIRVTRPNAIGLFFRYTMRRGNFSRIDRCLQPGITAPRRRCTVF